jgi:hypothetical protein
MRTCLMFQQHNILVLWEYCKNNTPLCCSYRAVSTLHLGYKYQLALYTEIVGVCSEIRTIHRTHKYTERGRRQNLNQV